MKLNIAIIDDEAPFRKSITAAIDEWVKKSKISAAVNEYSSAESFLFAYEEKKDYDLLLLDIEMDGINGVEMAKRIRHEDETVQIIFITGYPDYMCQGYDLSALHYLIKPVSNEKLFEVLDRALKNIKKGGNRVIFTTDGGEKVVTLDAILYAESYSHNMHIVTTDGAFDVRMTISLLAEILGSEFIITHRSYIVNLSHIVFLSKSDITLDSGEKIPISRNEFKKVHSCFVKYNKGALV